MEEQGDVVSFGPFRLYPGQRKLLCQGVEVRLGGRAMDVLRALAKKKGALVHSDELFAAAWSDVFVHESNLKVTVASLRRTLREYSPSHDYIRNVVGRGYWLSSDVRPLSSSEDIPRSAPLPELRTIIGRDDGNRSTLRNDGPLSTIDDRRCRRNGKDDRGSCRGANIRG